MEFNMKPKTIVASFVALLIAGGITFAMVSSGENARKVSTASNALVSEAKAESKTITIYADPNCGCCNVYAKYLEKNGYQVTLVADRNFNKRSIAAGVPGQGVGCHLAEIDGYYVSGLVPVEIIERLVTERPKITGITLPGMPSNAPGMARMKIGALKIYAFGADGTSVYSNE
jgi:hypothetical protein